MFELWAKRRPVEGKGFPYEFICSFNNEDCKYSAMDILDRDVYQEALIIRSEDNSCILYREFENEKTLLKIKKCRF